MRITQISIYNRIPPENRSTPKKSVTNNKSQNFELTNNYYTPINFKSLSLKYLNAKKYLNDEILLRLKQKKLSENPDLFSFNLNKLDGIQEGITVFKDMTMKEIAFILTTVSEFATHRGCFNNCLHCYADAKPPIKETDEYTKGMYWEDFINLTDGIDALNKRLGFYASGRNSKDENRYIAPFHDGDSINTCIKDKFGREHDYIEISDRLYDVMGIKSVWDTAGWNLTDKKSQERAEKYVEYYSDPTNRENIDQINISFNTFHAIHAKEVELRKSNNFELADKLRDIYTTRMANVFYTFTPLHKAKEFGIIMSSLPNEEEFNGFSENDLTDLFNETLYKLRDLYIKDLNSEQKFVKSKKEITSRLNALKKAQRPLRIITLTDKIKTKFSKNSETAKKTKQLLDKTRRFIKKESNDIDDYRINFVGMIDSNGRYYLTNYRLTYPTELRLNFINNKKTAAIKPEFQEKVMLSKDQINNLRYW